MNRYFNKLFKTTLIVFFLGVSCYYLFWYTYLNSVPKSVRPALKAVVKAYYLSKITGSYWENEMELQVNKITNLSQNERISFFRNIMLTTCDLDTSRATAFVNLLGDDASALRVDLINLKKSPDFNSFSKKQQKIVSDWIKGLAVIVNQKSWYKE